MTPLGPTVINTVSNDTKTQSKHSIRKDSKQMFLFYISAMMLKTLEFYLENVHKKKLHTKCKDIFVKIKKLV